MAKLLLVDDDQAFAADLSSWLAKENYQIERVSNGRDAVEMLASYKYDLILLDWDMPNMSGVDVLRQFRASGGKTPVLMLTGKDMIADKALGLDSGADDYLTKPFHPVELSSRIRALIRRAAGQTDSFLQIGKLSLNPNTGQVKIDGVESQLKRKEVALLEFLMRHPDQCFSAEALLERVWTSDSEASTNTIKSHVYTLRKKLEAAGVGELIQTIPGLGYKIAGN